MNYSSLDLISEETIKAGLQARVFLVSFAILQIKL